MSDIERRSVERPSSGEYRGERSGAPRSAGPRGEAPRNGAPRSGAPRSGAPRSSEYGSAGTRSTGARGEASRSGYSRNSSRPQGSRGPADRAYDERRSQSTGRGPSSRNASNGRRKKKSKAGKIAIFAIELVVLGVMIFILKSVLSTTKVGKVELPKEDIIINEEVRAKMEGEGGEGSTSGDGQTGTMSGYRNIALFGVDSREKALTKNTRSDTIIIASVNEGTGDIKLVSVYRDTYLNLSNDSYNKCNAAYAKGGPMQAINMLNMNLDMNITDFVTIGFDGLIDVIDAMGGVEVDVLESEIVHLNNYQISMVGKTTDGTNFTATAGTDYIPVTTAGRQTLNGLQATAYCRIRYVGNDFMRAERQRSVIKAILEKAKTNPTKLPSVAESLFDEVYTSLDLSEIVSLLGEITKYQIVGESGFPTDDKITTGTIGEKGSCVIPLDLKSNVSWLHEFLFNDTGYEPSSAVQGYSEKIKSDTGKYL